MKYVWLQLLLFVVCYCQAQQLQPPVFITVPAARYQVGEKDFLSNPLRTVTLDSFRISVTEITNAQFAAFVAATGYTTEAERKHNALVFEPGLEEFRWIEDSTAYWRYPNGRSRGGIEEKMDHPVTTISYTDAIAFCNWAGFRLPSLDEWEVASRAGNSDHRYFWGNKKEKISRYANIWHGRNHLVADSSDGYMYTAPVGSFKPNPWGLFDVYGNVFEFCSGKAPLDKPNSKVVHARGGSWWCSKNSCNYFNSVNIGTVNPHASFSNQGFRVVKP
ncbi:MAG: SUMF1/EgtB/PvdO family nonheme iron enzyme [Chitinophaga sp.]|uniref:SUMF1/EgtB/PvdO family nonheme iron enzyme n=1 Tax=Chitinophaga sp. TaxID=1869181 RepID=UPI0025C6C356|nr:SUMF1/EgtB/PvdO family nonheme iron enzyme [Chitinophaga sp.]MBV8251322.1 SUMF1/EgtB/PvdO family nonheme iron enzyme [Chitinophaga sp.]